MLWNGLGMEVPKKHKKKKTHKEHKVKSVGDAFVQLDKDQAIHTDADQNRRRRTLELTKKNNSWGFTLQTYGIRHKKSSEVEVMTYVDYVEMDSSACFAGLRRGDVILAVDGESVDHMTHRELVDRLRKCQQSMRLIVLFEDCHRKVELHDRLIKLKTILKGKLQEVKELGEKERKLLLKLPGFSRLDALRMSACSSVSSVDSSWDKYSMVYPVRASGNTNTSASSMSDEQEALTDSLSMASSAYSEDGQLSMEGSVVASSDNVESESDNFSDSVFLPNNNRSSVIFKPKFSLPPAEPKNEIIDGISDSKTDISTENSQQVLLGSFETQNSSKETNKSSIGCSASSVSTHNQSGESLSVNDTQSELSMQNLTVSDGQSKERISNSKLLDQSDLSSDASSLDKVDCTVSKMVDKTENETENVDSAKQNNSSKDRRKKQLNSSSSRRSIPECMINESDEVTKL